MQTVVGYTGGKFDKPTYDDVCSGKTGHSEAVRVSYDPEQTSLKLILQEYWKISAPMFPQILGGPQYRSIIFFNSKEQEAAIRKEKLALEGQLRRKVYTDVLPAKTFYRAEEYHQNYYKKNNAGYCKAR